MLKKLSIYTSLLAAASSLWLSAFYSGELFGRVSQGGFVIVHDGGQVISISYFLHFLVFLTIFLSLVLIKRRMVLVFLQLVSSVVLFFAYRSLAPELTGFGTDFEFLEAIRTRVHYPSIHLLSLISSFLCLLFALIDMLRIRATSATVDSEL